MEITSLNQLDMKATYSYADYLTWKFDEYVELIKGKVFKMSPAPLNYHQRISTSILTEFGYYLKKKKCKVFSAPFDVRLLKDIKEDKDVFTVVQPDICIICDPNKLDPKGRGCIGAPDLIVEILSKSTSKKDYNEKFNLYEETGVREYWIVSPAEKFVSVYVLINDKYELKDHYEEGTVPVGIFEDFEIAIEDIFAD